MSSKCPYVDKLAFFNRKIDRTGVGQAWSSVHYLSIAYDCVIHGGVANRTNLGPKMLAPKRGEAYGAK